MDLGIKEYLFGIIVVFVAIDTGIHDIFPDFSIITILIDLSFIIGVLWTWKDIFLQRIVYLDIITPFMFFFRMMLSIVILFGESVTSLIFDIIGYIFGSIAQGFTAFGIPTVYEIPLAGQYFSIDITTITVRIGLGLDFLGNGVIGEVQFSMFGASAFQPSDTRYNFAELGLFGIQAKISTLILEQVDQFLGVKVSLEDSIATAFEYFFSQNGSLAAIYYEMIDYLQYG